MNNNNNQFKQPKTIHEMLGMEMRGFPAVMVGTSDSAKAAEKPAPMDLPVVNGDSAKEEFGYELQEKESAMREEGNVPGVTSGEQYRPPARRPILQRNVMVYPVIFAAAFGLFYTILNFSAVKNQVLGIFTPPEGAEPIAAAELDTAKYDKWIAARIAHTNNLQVLHPNEDPDNDGIVNSLEYYIGTNPFMRDTDGDNSDDGSEILNSANPLYAGELTSEQRMIVSKYFDLDEIASRKRFSDVAGERAVSFPVDTSRNGRIEIPKLNVSAPIIWSDDFVGMEEDLKSGAAHHPDTPLPGSRGTASVHGHSSGNIGDGNYKTVFSRINFLEAGDEVFVVLPGPDGEVNRLLYVVRSKQVYEKDDPAQFADMNGYHLNLSTSWPVGTARQRYVVTTELAGL